MTKNTPNPEAQVAELAFKKYSRGKSANRLNDEILQLSEITRLAEAQLALEREIQATQATLEGQVKRLNQVRLELLPAALNEAGLRELRLASGHRVQLAMDYTCSLTGRYRDPAVAWLKAEGLEDVISYDVVESFGPRDVKQLERLRKALLKLGVGFSEKENVNTATFKALVRERLEAGEQVPLGELGVTAIESTKITAPPKRR